MTDDATLPGISTIILAAGENTRLKGVIPAFTKPMMLVNGSPLIHHAYNHAHGAWRTDQLVIVVSPNNASMMTELMQHDEYVQWVMQPTPAGVVDAIYRAIFLCRHERVLILCADNTFAFEPDVNVEEYRLCREAVIGTRHLDFRLAARFTTIVDGNIRPPGEVNNSAAATTCWIGPLVLRTHRTKRVLLEHRWMDLRIEDLIRLSTGGTFREVRMLCEDFGIPEQLLEKR